MCRFFSAIWSRDGRLLWHWCSDHHSDLIRIFGLKDDREEHFVRVEFTPPDDLKTVADVETWNFNLDEEREPGWFDAEVRGECVKQLRLVIGSHIVTDTRDVLTDGPWVLAGEASVSTILCGRIALMAGSSKVGVMRESSNVGVMRESSNVGVMWESSKVGVMRESSNVGVMRESSNVGVMWGSSKVGVMRESSKVGEMRESSKVTTDKRAKAEVAHA